MVEDERLEPSLLSLFILELRRSIPFPVRVVGNVWIPPKASFFVWEAS